jgi:hypothetical protein
MDQSKLNKIIDIIRSNLNEEVPTNALAHGQIAGTAEAGDDPPVRRRKKKYITNGRGSRKNWLDYLKSSNGRRH